MFGQSVWLIIFVKKKVFQLKWVFCFCKKKITSFWVTEIGSLILGGLHAFLLTATLCQGKEKAVHQIWGRQAVKLKMYNFVKKLVCDTFCTISLKYLNASFAQNAKVQYRQSPWFSNLFG